jgi:hypothetical protein
MSAPLELCEWLGAATRGLPTSIKARLYDELTAHYEDAYADAAEAGSSAEDAHRHSLAQLGDPRAVAKALCDTHLARRRYAWAMGAALFSLVWIVGAAVMIGSSILISSVAFLLSIVILRSFKRLLEANLETTPLGLPIAWIEVCTLLVIIGGILGSFDSLHYPGSLMLTDPILLSRNTLFMHQITALHVLLAVGVGGVGVGWLILSERLIESGDTLKGLAPSLRAAILVNGLALVASGIALIMRNSDAVNLTTLIAAVSGVARQALLTLVFYRAAFPRNHTSQPRGLA